MSEAKRSPQEVLADYLAGPDLLDRVSTLSKAELDGAPAGGGWTVRQIVHHLADGEGILTCWLKVALATPGATFPMDWYPGNDEWVNSLDYTDRDIAPALALFRANRQYVAALVNQLIDRWDQPAKVHFRGSDKAMDITVGGMINLWVRHLEEPGRRRGGHYIVEVELPCKPGLNHEFPVRKSDFRGYSLDGQGLFNGRYIGLVFHSVAKDIRFSLVI